ncbi:MAG: hypothetical protein HN961_09360 [Planctomycetes bacterium]|jgi:tetratricopeptide (TPR) repeat protein|nr:hypothetical protein [Planctomycetota bacterium]MBT5102371.1 hypothetical protein [Planctomycetota bacterium]MBT7013104.1 hypothetical protein [Planctomycetota bacterium]
MGRPGTPTSNRADIMTLASIPARIAALGLITFCAAACQSNIHPRSQSELAPAMAAAQSNDWETVADSLESFKVESFDRNARPIFLRLAGDSHWELGKIDPAINYYRAYIQSPDSRADAFRIGNRLLKVGTEYLQGTRKGFLGFFSAPARGETILDDLATYHYQNDDLKADALIRLGHYHLEEGAFTEAKIDFDNLIERFTGTKYEDVGTFRAAQASYFRIISPESGVTDMRTARNLLTSYLLHFSQTGAYVDEATQLLVQVDSLIAQHYVVVGDFYAKINNLRGARNAYLEAERYTGTEGAANALKNRQALPHDTKPIVAEPAATEEGS